MIIVEGMDNTGKTTLIKSLVAQFDLEYRGSASELRGDPSKLVAWVDEELARPTVKPPIYDRFPLISEEVYGPILRGRSSIPERRYDGWAQAHSVLFIYCRPPLGYIRRWGTREQMEGVKEFDKELIARYDRVMHRYRCRGWGVIRYDYSDTESHARLLGLVGQYVDSYKPFIPEEISHGKH